MARFKYNEAENYGGQGGAGFFSLKNDKDVASVRFLNNTIEDVDGYAVHQVELDGKKRYVNCLRAYNEPIDKCPLCREKYFQTAKLFIPLYNIDEDKVQIWERGKKFFAKISSICARYASKDNLVSHTFEIERNGKAGSTQTVYEIYETGNDGASLDDLPEAPEILGGFILDKTADEMEAFLNTGEFPSNNTEEEPTRRRTTRQESAEPTRRTPTRGGNRRGDAF